MGESITEKMIVKALDKSYQLTMEGIPSINFESATELAEKYLARDGSLENKVDALIRAESMKAAANGFFTGLPGGPLGYVAIPLNIQSVLTLQTRMVATIAYMNGYDLDDERVKSLVFLCYAGDQITRILKDAGITAGKKFAYSLIAKISGKTLTKINQAVGFRLVTKFGEKGVVNLGKMIPVIGGIISGSVDKYTTNKVGASAKKMFLSSDSVKGEAMNKKQDADLGNLEEDLSLNQTNLHFTDMSQSSKPSKHSFFSGFSSVFHNGRKSFLLATTLSMLLFLVGNSLLDYFTYHPAPDVLPDNSHVILNIRRQVPDKVLFIYHNQDGKLVRRVADRKAYTQFAQTHFAEMEEQRTQLLKWLARNLVAKNHLVFEQMQKRISHFSDWYYSLGTSYKILMVSLKPTDHVEYYINRQFMHLVLKPELSNPVLNTNALVVLKQAHSRYLQFMAKMNEDFQKFVAQKTDLYQPLDDNKITVAIDWDKQKQRMREYAGETEWNSKISALLPFGFGVMGYKLTSTASKKTFEKAAEKNALQKSTAEKLVANKVEKNLLSKSLSRDLVVKTSTRAGRLLFASEAGGLTGPAGFALGITAGTALDYMFVKLDEWNNRDQFEQDVRLRLINFETLHDRKVITALNKGVNTWFEDTTNLLATFNPQTKKETERKNIKI